ncbi:apical endosomal glycoprotein [Pygocentrus nattereri]|uniref:apical endosomal glycoprotein n=1 Tax=Pygocentrus nattereri TaxID=42514 RepID=UPI000814B03E|nr:apical endosomal glycoprotein [Pygocentrus nattereri]
MMKGHSIQLLALLLVVQQAVTQESRACVGPRCDFVCDCTDCSDEQDCGYRGRDFVCDFEDAGMCGWTDRSSDGGYVWERRQRGHPVPDSGPSSDYTIGTSTGWFMAVTAVMTGLPSTAILMSPLISQSAPTCRLRLRYFIWDSGYTGLGNSSLWGSVWQPDEQNALVWRPENISVRAWREDTIFLGRIPAPFYIQLHSQRQEGRRGDIAIDQLEFLDCALPVPSGSGGCEEGYLKCKRGGCVKERVVCDGTDDCGDGTDEQNCGQYMSCDFEDDLCGWDLRSLSSLKWISTSQINISVSEPLRGPGRDHSNNSASGHFLYVTKPDVWKNDWASFQSPRLAPTNSTHPCRMVMYTHQFGGVSGGLSVLVAEREIYPVWERGGSLGDLWVKAEVEFVVNSTFQILFVAAIRDQAYGGIAVDDITLSPECLFTNESMPRPSFPNPPKHPCTEASKICDFQSDCKDGEDEAQCGDFSFEQGSAGWTDVSIGSQSWKLSQENSVNNFTEVFLYVTDAPGQQLTEAQTRTPLLGPSGPSCTLQFSYSLSGSNPHTGELSVAVVDSVLGTLPRLWEFSGQTGQDTVSWVKEELYIGARDHRFQLEFRAHAQELNSGARIAVKDVHYVNCHPQYIPSASDGPSCNFETDLCGWYQDQTDNYDWSVMNGSDHTIGSGRSLVVDMWSTTLRGLYGRLLSHRQSSLTEHCLLFFYKLYGPQTGALNVKVLHSDGSEQLLWTRVGAHGNLWQEGHCPVPSQLTTYQLVFEAVRSGFDGLVAIDDVAFVEGSCSVPTMCSFEGHTCGYSSSGASAWVHQNWDSTRTGPKTDHSLETEMGYYMLAHSSVEVLPQDNVMTLSSPVRHGVAHIECVHFWYHTRGDNPGTLTVYKKPVKGGKTKLFTSSLSQGHMWHIGMSDISQNGDWQLQFEVEGAGGKGTYIAIDDVVFSSHSCPTSGGVCGLEQGLCGWSNTQSPYVDHLDWELSSLLFETHYPTPPYDHTLGNERGHFLFLPNTLRDTAGQNAWLLSPHLPPTKGTCLFFWGYQPVADDSKLVVWRLSEGATHELLSLSHAGGNWRSFRINITSEKEYQIVFEGFKGAKGVLALDDFGYTVGVNCKGEQIDHTTSPSRDYTGETVAIVIVTILLVVAACGLLVYYLKKKAKAQNSSSSADNTGFTNEMYDSSLAEDHVTIRSISE